MMISNVSSLFEQFNPVWVEEAVTMDFNNFTFV